MSLRKEEACSSSPWLAFPENNCMQGNGVLEVHSQKTMSSGTVVNGLGNQQPISPSTPNIVMRSSPPVCTGRGVMCLQHIDCLFTTHSAINQPHTQLFYRTERFLYIILQGIVNMLSGVSRAIPGKNYSVILYISSNTK